MNRILVTGGAGFIGSNLVLHLLRSQPEAVVVNLDSLTYAANLLNLKTADAFPNYRFVAGDIRNRETVQSLFAEYKFDSVFHLAAESHVDNSISGPGVFFETNVLGTYNLIETARHQWMSAPFQFQAGKEKNRFLHVSTDEVYGSLGATGFFTEETAYAPNSPYSASKAGSDFVVRSYHHTFGMNIVTTNCSNNYGPHQHQEKLIPKVISNAIAGLSIPVYGDGKNVRDWLYVEDHCRALEQVMLKGRSGQQYNIGGKNEMQNIQIVKLICALLDKNLPKENFRHESLIKYVADRPGHDKRYAIENKKIQNELGWSPLETFETGIAKTVQWYLKSLGHQNSTNVSVQK